MAKQEQETRAFSKLETRSVNEEDNTMTVDGYAIVWDVEYPIGGGAASATGFDEKISRGAATKSLKEKADIRMLINHGKGTGIPVARYPKTMSVTEDEIGLRVTAKLDLKNPAVQELKSAMDREDIDNMSFGFIATRQAWSDDYTKRDIKEFKIDDVSIVTYPASEATLIKARSREEAQAETRPAAPLTTPALDEIRNLAESLKK